MQQLLWIHFEDDSWRSQLGARLEPARPYSFQFFTISVFRFLCVSGTLDFLLRGWNIFGNPNGPIACDAQSRFLFSKRVYPRTIIGNDNAG